MGTLIYAELVAAMIFPEFLESWKQCSAWHFLGRTGAVLNWVQLKPFLGWLGMSPKKAMGTSQSCLSSGQLIRMTLLTGRTSVLVNRSLRH
jgi:hypothetical protein